MDNNSDADMVIINDNGYLTNVPNKKEVVCKPQIDKYGIIKSEMGTKIFIKNRLNGRNVCKFDMDDKDFCEELAEICLRKIEEREMELGK